jgi:hypothetical protein
VAHAGTANKATHGEPDASCRSHEEREYVRRNARSTGIAAGGDHRGMFAVLPGSLRHAPCPDLLHSLSVGPLTFRPNGRPALQRISVGPPRFELGTSSPPAAFAARQATVTPLPSESWFRDVLPSICRSRTRPERPPCDSAPAAPSLHPGRREAGKRSWRRPASILVDRTPIGRRPARNL